MLIAICPRTLVLRLRLSWKNVFNKNSVAEFLELFEQEKADMEQRAIDRGLLQEAGSNATEQLIDFIYSLPGMDAYNIVVRTA